MRVQDFILDEAPPVGPADTTDPTDAKPKSRQRQRSPVTYEVMRDEDGLGATIVRACGRSRRELRVDLESRQGMSEFSKVLRGCRETLDVVPWALPFDGSARERIADFYEGISIPRDNNAIKRLILEDIIDFPWQNLYHEVRVALTPTGNANAHSMVDAMRAIRDASRRVGLEIPVPSVEYPSYGTQSWISCHDEAPARIVSAVRLAGTEGFACAIETFLREGFEMSEIGEMPTIAFLHPQRTIDYLHTAPTRNGFDRDEFVPEWRNELQRQEREHGRVTEAFPPYLHEVASRDQVRDIMRKKRPLIQTVTRCRKESERLTERTGLLFDMVPLSLDMLYNIRSEAIRVMTPDTQAVMTMRALDPDEPIQPVIVVVKHIVAKDERQSFVRHSRMPLYKTALPPRQAQAYLDWCERHDIVPDPDMTVPDSSLKIGNSQSDTSFEVTLSNGIDAVVTRRADKDERQLVLLMSQRQFYMRNLRTQKVSPLNERTLRPFLKGIDSLEGKPVPWVCRFVDAPWFARGLTRVLAKREFCNLAQRGVVSIGVDELRREAKDGYTSTGYEPFVARMHAASEHIKSPVFRQLWTMCERTCDRRILAREFGHELTRKETQLLNSDFVYAFADKFGVQPALVLAERYLADWVTRYAYCPGSIASWSTRLLDQLGECDYRRVIDYLFETSIHEHISMDTIVTMWDDSLRMQQMSDGRITERYPKHLYATHDRLVRERRKKDAMERDQRLSGAFESRAQELEGLCAIDEHYLIRPPKSPNELLDEGRQQQNCVSTYADMHATGRTTILLMRDAKRPDKSLVTIEVLNGYVSQAKTRFNGKLTKNQHAWLRQWAERNHIRM